jgi:hypothetical protein
VSVSTAYNLSLAVAAAALVRIFLVGDTTDEASTPVIAAEMMRGADKPRDGDGVCTAPAFRPTTRTRQDFRYRDVLHGRQKLRCPPGPMTHWQTAGRARGQHRDDSSRDSEYSLRSSVLAVALAPCVATCSVEAGRLSGTDSDGTLAGRGAPRRRHPSRDRIADGKRALALILMGTIDGHKDWHTHSVCTIAREK